MRFGQRFFVHDLFAFKLAVRELETHPFRQIINRRTHPTRRRLRIWIAFELLHPFAIYQHMPQCFVPARHKIRITRASRGHAKRVVQLLFGRFFPFQLVRFRCRNAAFRHTKIRVRVMRAETAPRMLIAQSTQSFRALETQILEQVASMLGQAAAMRVHVANGDLASYPRIEHCECWIEYADLRVPSYFPSPTSPATTVEPIGLEREAS